MATLTELERYLVAAGLLVEVIEDVSERGNILRNWELVDAKNMDGVRSFVPALVMTTVKALRNIAPGLLPPGPAHPDRRRGRPHRSRAGRAPS